MARLDVCCSILRPHWLGLEGSQIKLETGKSGNARQQADQQAGVTRSCPSWLLFCDVSSKGRFLDKDGTLRLIYGTDLMTIGYCFRSLLSYVGLSKDLILSPDSQTYSSESVLSSHSLLHVTHQKECFIIDTSCTPYPAQKSNINQTLDAWSNS